MLDLYSILGLSRRANSEEIKAAYWILAKRSHPDVNPGDKEAERRTKEINRAYETLGDPEARAAYDLELARQRAKARRNFWSAAATGVATFMLTVGSVSVTVMWRQHVEIHQSPSGEATLLSTNAKNENPVAKPPAEDRANLRSAGLAGSDRRDVPSDPVSAPLPGAFEEPPTWANSQIASAPLRDREAQIRGEPTAQSSPILERPPQEEVASAPSPELVRQLQLPEGQPLAPAPAPRDAPPRTELANAVSPEVGVKQPMPATTVDQPSSGESTRRDADRKTTAVGRIHKKSKQFNMAKTAGPTIPDKMERSQQERPLISTSHMALRWPSADEPYVNVGVRNR